MSRKQSTPVSTEIDVDEIKAFYDSVYHADAQANEEGRLRGHYSRLLDRLGIQKDARTRKRGKISAMALM